ncbi:MAG: hypothetical protein Tsb002_38270 [Wenzhouxiangellaceae bacterium]
MIFIQAWRQLARSTLYAALLAAVLLAQAQAQPGFSQYVFDSPLQYYSGDPVSLYNSDPEAFRADYFPKLTIPLRREDFFGVWNYRNHTYDWPWLMNDEVVYDGDVQKKTYLTASGYDHDAVDWWVSFRNWGANEVVNPFPQGAVVKVTSVQDGWPDIPDDTLGNTIELTCYLDGNVNNQNSVNKLILSFAHLKQYSAQVVVGDFVTPGQVLAQVGNSGLTSLPVTHIHLRYIHRGHRLDPFYGSYNKHLSESMFYDQAWVERITNYKVTENQKHLTLNGAFFVEMQNQQTNHYRFESFQQIDHIRVGNGAGGVVPNYDVLTQPGISNLRHDSFQWQDAEGSFHTVYRVRFDWYQNAAPSLLNQDIEFRSETPNGKLSNRVFVVVKP